MALCTRGRSEVEYYPYNLYMCTISVLRLTVMVNLLFLAVGSLLNVLNFLPRRAAKNN